MTEKMKQLSVELDEARRQRDVYAHQVERLQNREKSTRSRLDRRRTHRLIQYGAAFESNVKELGGLSDPEIFQFVEKLLDLPEVQMVIREALKNHSSSVTDPVTEGGDV